MALGQGHFLTFGTFTSPHKVGHLRILEQGQIQIPTLARGGGGGGGFGVYVDFMHKIQMTDRNQFTVSQV